MMIGGVDVKACCIIEVMNPPDQSVFFERGNCSVYSVKRYRFEVFSHLSEDIFYRWMIRSSQQRFEDLNSLMSDLETSGFADSLEVVQHV